MKQAFLSLLIVAVAIGTSPESVIRFDPTVEKAEAGFRGGGGGRGGGGRGGGGRGYGGGGRGGGGGFGARPYQPPRGARAGAEIGTRPSRPEIDTRPSRPSDGLDRPGVSPPGGRPGTGDRPGADRPTTLPARPGAGERPPRPTHPIARPPGWRPPGSRPPGWRPPPYEPPYYRPPHWYWGDYYWWPSWGWYFTGAVAGATLVYVATLPAACDEVLYEGETLYLCNGMLYRATYYQDELVYEIVSDETVEPAPAAGGGGSVVGLSLASPYMRGEEVRSLQRALTDAGYGVGGIDGSFGPGTDRALRAFQRDRGLPQTGAVDGETAAALGL